MTPDSAQARSVYDRQLSELADWFVALTLGEQADVRESILACPQPVRKLATLGYGAITDTIITRAEGEITE